METATTDPTRTLDPAELFEFLIGTLCGVVEIVGGRHGLTAAVIGLIWRRVRRLGDRFARLVERVRAGGFCDTAPARNRDAAGRQEGAAETAAIWPRRALGGLRRHFGWLVHLLHETEGSKGRMYWILARPEMKELIAEAPLHLGRILRPLCRMLGVEVPIAVLLAEREQRATVVSELEAVSAEPAEEQAEVAPAPVAVSAEPAEERASPRRRVAKYPPAPDFLVNTPGAIHRPDGSIWLRIGASSHWRPGGSWETLEEAQKFDPPIRIWPREE